MLKKTIILAALFLSIMLVCCSCNTPENSNDLGENSDPVESPATMTRINIFQTGVLGLTPQSVEDKNNTVTAYSIQEYIDNNFAADLANPVVLVASDGYMASTQAEEFIKHYITIEGEYAPLLVGPEVADELRVKYLTYIKTANESICFVADTLDVGEMFSALGMVEADSYKFMATDGFSRDVDSADIAECILSKSGTSVNGTLAGLTGGDIRDVLYIEAVK